MKKIVKLLSYSLGAYFMACCCNKIQESKRRKYAMDSTLERAEKQSEKNKLRKNEYEPEIA